MTTAKALDGIKAAARETGDDVLIRIRADPKYEEVGELVRVSSMTEEGERFGVGMTVAAAWEAYLEAE